MKKRIPESMRKKMASLGRKSWLARLKAATAKPKKKAA